MQKQTKKSVFPPSFRTKNHALTSAMTGTTLALGISTAMMTSFPVFAADKEISQDTQLGTVKVVERAIDPNPNAEPGVAYKAKKSGDDRHTRPLAETPQTITVLTQAMIQDTGRNDLRDILRTQPGITLGTGENGNAFGDRYIIRGQEARSDVFVDGLRDPGMTVRESFAVDQIEITKGPSSTFAGRGATGGAVNSVTKQASTDTDFTKLSGGVGTDSFRRFTVDTNRVLTDDSAVRVNLLHSYQDVPERSPANRERNGAAISFNYTPTSDLDITADYYHLDAKDRPDLGSYFANGAPVSDVPVYSQTGDFLKSSIDAATLRANYQASSDIKVSNLLRYGRTKNQYVVTGTRAATTDTSNPTGVYSALTPSTHQGWQNVDYLADQLNLHVDQKLFNLDHQFIFSLEFSDNHVQNGNFTATSTGATNCIVKDARTGVAAAGYCLTDSTGGAVSNIADLLQRNIVKGAADIDWRTKTVSLAAMDTVDLTDKWTAFAGLRYDHFDYSNTVTDARTSTVTTYKLKDGMWNSHLGVTYKFHPDANIYATYSTASDFNGGESDVANCGYGGICVPSGTTTADSLAMFASSKPEKSKNFELGTKWNIYGGKLLATAALFQVTKSDVMENTTSTNYSLIGSINTGKFRVEGFEFGLSGQLTSKLSAQAGAAFMNSEWLSSQTATNVGKGLSNFPEKSATVLLNYEIEDGFNLGGGVTYSGQKYSGSPEAPRGANRVPGYTVWDLFGNYQITKQLSAKLNVNNVMNTKYYLATYTSGTFTYLGDARNVRLTFNYDF